ncbi:SRPBCC family protein [Halorubrum sp. SP3]|uniref:SRPBCC family protein n=1 Tax=unclassified Halorubrum TaxID=2642239 RepID=UPI0010F716AE|nr:MULTISPECIES: SRPBCC family protein [unclassified Halorubrum]TKX53091.1 SRPBCC family protein [Halorubrum sp. SP3]TKX68161.1 SRPBCC family protein [Halorubrum sp. SP9]
MSDDRSDPDGAADGSNDRRDDPFAASDAVVVAADAETVFAFLDDPANHAAITPGLTDVRDVEPLENGGKRLSYTYRMAGVGIDGEIVQTVHDPPERHAFELRGRLTGTIDLRLAPVDGGTELTYAATYDLPENALTKVGAPVIRRFNERQLRAALENVAAAFDGE